MKINGKHTLLFAAAAALSLSACSSEEVEGPNVPVADGGISFSVGLNDDAAEQGPRSRAMAADTRPDNYIIDKNNFATVCPFFRIQICRNNGGTWENLPTTWLNHFTSGWHLAKVADNASENAKNNRQYLSSDFLSNQELWNDSETNFYAMAGFANDYRWEGIPKIEYIDGNRGWGVKNVEFWNSYPVDFLWTFRQEKRNSAEWETKGNVNLVFNHAMSRLNFKFKNTNKNIKVEVRDVYVANIYRCATFSIDKAKDLYMNGNFRQDMPANHGSVDASNLGNIWSDYKLKWKADLRSGMNTIVLNGVTTDEQTATSPLGGNYTMLVIPQTVGRWNPADNNHTRVARETEYAGYDNRHNMNNNVPGYLVINCKITDVNTGLVLWESTNRDGNQGAHQEDGVYNTDYEHLNGVIIPLTPQGQDSYTWLPSRSYTYHVVFGEGAGWDDNGNPILVPIRIYATVAPFTELPVSLPAN